MFIESMICSYTMNRMGLKIQFLGAAQTVTGSRTLVTHAGLRTLVDCGLFQGPKELRKLNWEPFLDPSKVSNVVLTHAHIDHSGYLPRFVKDGYSGPVYASEGTADLLGVLLPDSAYLQEEDAEFANRTGHSKHKPALPLYNARDAEQALRLVRRVKRNTWVDLGRDCSFRLLRSGHIIGSSFVQIASPNGDGVRTLTFSGDLGNGRSPTLSPPVSILETDYLVLESTYGNRIQPRTDPKIDLANAVNKVASRNGVLLIPAFSVGRSQELLFLLRQLEQENQIPSVPVFLDSPMSVDATRIFLNHPEDHRLVVTDHHLEPPICPTCYKEVRTPMESFALTQQSGPMIIISAAGMLTGGRILHHLKSRLPREANGVLFVGYQAESTKGRILQSGVDEIRVHHETVPVRAEIMSIESLSAHADLVDTLDWLKGFKRAPRKVFINHGEPEASRTLAEQVRLQFGWNVEVAIQNKEYKLE